MNILQYIEEAYKKSASDLHWTEGEAVWLQIQGGLFVTEDRLSLPDIQSLLQAAGMENVIENKKHQEFDFSYTHPAGIRVRVHAYWHMGLLSLAIRLLPKEIPSPQEIQLPDVVLSLIQRKSGLLLVTGPTGSGKSTTLASLVHYINQTMALHIVTLEDPIEYVHIAIRSKITQREIGVDTSSFAQGIHTSLRQDPDIIVIGELRDEETIHAAIRAAEAGRLVLGTLHTSRAMFAVQRLIDAFEEGRQNLARAQLAASLRGVISQRLTKKEGSQERTAQFEILINTPGIANLVRSNQMHQIQSLMQAGTIHGMQLFGDMDNE